MINDLPDLSDIFADYEKLAADADKIFSAVQQGHPDCVTCEKGCSDCCHALFDLSLVEALYMNKTFNQNLEGLARSNVLDRCDQADRESTRIKRNMYKAKKLGVSEEDLMAAAAGVRLRCPLLNEEDACDMYANRPITCRLYGVPLKVAGQGRTCGKTGFQKGGAYPTADMDRIQDRLAAMSLDIARRLNTKYPELHMMYVPMSMALLNRYTKDYLGAR